MKKHHGKKGNGKINREEIIQLLIKKRLENNLSINTMVRFCMETFNYQQSYAYELVRETRLRISSIYKDWNVNALEEAIGELEEQLEGASRDKNRKLMLDITKEINKLKGLYVDKVEHSGSVNIETIKLKEIYKPNE